MPTKDDVMRAQFERAVLEYSIARRKEGRAHNDCGTPLTIESLCWRRDNGDYGVIMLNGAWWGWRMAMELAGKA